MNKAQIEKYNDYLYSRVSQLQDIIETEINDFVQETGVQIKRVDVSFVEATSFYNKFKRCIPAKVKIDLAVDTNIYD